MRFLFSFSLLFLSLLCVEAVPWPKLFCRNNPSQQTILTLLAGPITGLKYSSTLYKFLGIPYAEAPVGNNRFASPIPYPAACQAINATAYGNICPQASGGAEDCLNLNVFTGTISPLALRPVMFWIHGGSFMEGTGADPTFDGSTLVQNNVVVVTYNYRLGILGFLDGGSAFPTVNMGLQDTILALTWVRNNILFFGGDPSRVTVFGESSGATMIRALMVSPKAKGLFKRAILQSDPMNYPIENRTISCDIIGAAVLSSLGCSDVACARALPVSQLVSATEEICSTGMSLNPMVPVTPLMPTIDGTWVSSDWSEAIESDSLQSEVDVIMGTVTNEATPEIFNNFPNPLPTSYYQYIMSFFVGASRAATIAGEPQFQLNMSDPDTVRNTLSEVGTLFFWACANQFNALAYANQANVYIYQLEVGATDPDNANDPLCVNEVCHEDDIEMVFGTYSSPSPTQSAVGAEIRGRWTSFAANGNPNVAGKVQWTPVGGPGNLNLLRMSGNSVINDTLYSDVCGPIFGNTVLYNFQMQ